MARFVLYYAVLVGGILSGNVLTAVVKSTANDAEPRIVEFLEEDEIELRCSSAERPYMNITSARFMESYQYDKRSNRCQIPQTFCQGIAIDIGRTTLQDKCLNKRSCQLSFSADDRRQANACGLSTPMRVVLAFQCHDTKLKLNTQSRAPESNPLMDSAACWNSLIRRWCG